MSKTTKVTALLGACLFSATVSVQAQTDAPGKLHSVVHESRAGKGATGKMSEEMMVERQEHMLKMHDLMHQIRDAKDSAQREKLKAEHRAMMQSHMKMMHGNKQKSKDADASKKAPVSSGRHQVEKP